MEFVEEVEGTGVAAVWEGDGVFEGVDSFNFLLREAYVTVAEKAVPGFFKFGAGHARIDVVIEGVLPCCLDGFLFDDSLCGCYCRSVLLGSIS